MRLPLKLTYNDTGHSLDRGIEYLAKPLGRDTLLIAVNADRNPVDVTFDVLKRFHRCEPMFESRPVAFEKNALHESFEPFGTRVWRLR